MITDEKHSWSRSSTPNESLVAPGASVPSWSCDHLLPQCTCGTEFISDFAVRPSDLPSVSVPGQPRDHLRLRLYCRPAPISAFERSHFVFRSWFSRFCSRTFAVIRAIFTPPPGASVRRSAFGFRTCLVRPPCPRSSTLVHAIRTNRDMGNNLDSGDG